MDPLWPVTPNVDSTERAALIYSDGRVLSRERVAGAVRAVAGTLGAQGFTRQDRVAMVMAPGAESAATLLGAMARTAVAPLSPSSPATVLTENFERLGISGVLVGDDSPEAATQAAARHGVPVVHIDPFRLDAADWYVPVAAKPTDLALLLQTSGTTAHPKVVPLTHGNLQASTHWLAGSLGLRADDRGLLVMPLFHISGIVASLLAPLAAGGSVICCRSTDPRELLDAMVDRCPTWLSASPAFFHALLAEVDARGGNPAAGNLRFLRTAGSPLDQKLAAALGEVFGVPVLESYGMTEVAGVDLYAIRGGEPEGSPEVAVLDAHGRRRSQGSPGEIAVRGHNVTGGYEGAERSGWIEAADGQRWFLTGDEGYLDTCGRLVLSGRIKEIINRGGEKVSPRRVEEALHAHSDVRQAVAFSVPHPTLGENVAAAVVPRDESAIGEDELRQHAADLLNPYEVPSRIVILNELPRTTLGKLRRADLADLLADDLASGMAQPQGELEMLVADIFAEVLTQARPGRDANFLMLGGDSLSGQRVTSRLGSALGRTLSPALLFEHPTVRGLAEQLADCQATAAGHSSRIPMALGHDVDVPRRGRAFPASLAQGRMWFLHQLAPDLTAYHMSSMWRLRGLLDVEALRRALDALIERHPTLRTAFAMNADELQQIVVPPPGVPLEVEPIGGRDVDSMLADWMEQEISRPFDLVSGILLRACLLQVSVNEHILLLNHHHISSDGWSHSVLARDLTDLYNAERSGSPRLTALRTTYQDYSVWQRERLSGNELDGLLSYWVPQLEGVAALELPTDRPRPPWPSHVGGRATFQIDADDLGAFEDLCRSEGATLQMGLLALIAVLLNRYSQQDDFAIGVPHWGRNHPDVEELVGLFLNTLPIRVRFDGMPSFRGFLRQVRHTSVAAYAHQELPFEQIVDSLALQRDTSRNPLVQVLVQLIEFPAPSLEGMAGIDVEPEFFGDNTVRLDLEFMLRRTPDGALRGTVAFARDLFDETRIKRLMEHLAVVLSEAVRDPDAAASALGILPAGERAQIKLWQSGLSVELPDICVHQMFQLQAERTPDDAAVVFGDEEICYSDLNARANRLAHQLIDSGVGPSDLVAVCLDRSAEWVVALLAILKAGGTYLPLDPGLPQSRLEHLLETSCAALLLTDDASMERFSSVSTPLLNSSLRARSQPHFAANPHGDRCTIDQPAYVLFTSGSTGIPKGVEVDHRVLANLVRWQAVHPRLGTPARTLQFASCGFDVSLQEVFTTLTAGGCLVLIDRATQKDTRRLLRELVDQRIERLFLPYVVLEQLAIHAAGAAVPHELRDVVSAGEQLALTPPIREFFAALPDCRLHNHYGPTESHVVTAEQLPSETDRWPAVASIGRPIDNTEILVLDAAGQPCPIGVPGALHIGGMGLARGYFRDREQTSARFTAFPDGSENSGRFFTSGDIASWSEQGTLMFHGRGDDQVKVRGFRVEPAEVEAALASHSGVAQAAAVVRGNSSADARLVAYWVPHSGARPAGEVAPDAAQLRAFLTQRLPDYMVPSAFVSLVSLPVTANGKLDRAALPSSDYDPRHFVAASSEAEHRLMTVWAEILGHEEFGIADNFFLVGGHSLSAVRLSAAVERDWAVTMPVAEVFRHPTIEEQARWLTRDGESESDRCGALDNLVILQPRGDLPPLYVLHGWRGTVATFIHLARALAPHRPLLGLQGREFVADAPLLTVPAVAVHYAEQILSRHEAGTPIHLLGYSAGGWLAHAVAGALLERGARIGMFAVLDTGDTADINRRLAVVARTHRLLPRLSVYLRRRLRAVLKHLDSHLQHRPSTEHSPRSAPTAGDNAQNYESDFYLVLIRRYRPARLPIAVDVFAPAARTRLLKVMWRFYALGGVRVWPIFENHADFIRSETASELASALESAMVEHEAN